MGKQIAALDIGGTSIKSGIWAGALMEETREYDTNAARGGVYVMERAKEILRTYHDFDAIGISTAGQVDSSLGCIRFANENIPGYSGMQIREILQDEFGVPVAVENDVNAAAIGESQFGAGSDFRDFLCVTYGTGVGGAIVLDKKVYTGSAFSAGEFGGIIVHPEDRLAGEPFSGCYEKYASTTALVRLAGEFDPSLDSGRKIFDRLNEEPVRRVVDGWIDEIVLGLVTLIHIFNPACVVMGGGVMAQPYILEQVEERTKGAVMSTFSSVELRAARLGNQAGLFGAASRAGQLLV